MKKYEYDYITGADGKQIAVKATTGECHDTITLTVPLGTQLITPEQQRENAESKNRREAEHWRRATNASLGQFCLVETSQDFPDLSPQTAARLVFINTYSDYTSGGLNKLFKNPKTKIPVMRRDLPDILRLSRKAADEFFNETSPKYLIKSDDDALSVNGSIFLRGRLKRKQYNPYQKIYIDGVRKLYSMVQPSQHKHLGYLFKMLPYVNLEYNVLCHNPLESNLDDIQLMTVSEFCGAIGYDISNWHRLNKIYKNLRFDVDGKQVRFCAFVTDGGNTSDMRIFVNPRVLYNGSDFNKVEVLGAFCR